MERGPMSDPVGDLKQELLAAAERRQAHATTETDRVRLRSHRRRNRVLLIAATLPIAAAVALLVTAPWSNSPGFLERAQAALTAPAGSVLYMRWEVTRTSTDFGCTVAAGPNEMWVDQTPPYRYRFIDHGTPPGAVDGTRATACASYTAIEYGGTLRPPQSVRFVPPDTLEHRGFGFGAPPDLVTSLREAIASGSAQDEGKTELDGRVVERIRMAPAPCPELMRSLKPPCPPPQPSYAYMDPETFLPVQIDSPYGIAAIKDDRVLRFHVVERYLTYEYLPRTAANLALTDIRAQHPDATGP
jgi:hypothetical protein